MHELGICDALVKMIGDIARDEGLDTIQSVTVEVGSLSGVMPHYLADCWKAVVDRTEFENTELIIEVMHGQARCMDCGEMFVADLEDLHCPKCRSDKLLPLNGKDLTLKEILA